MKHFFTCLAATIMISALASGQAFLFPENGHKVAYLQGGDGSIQAFELDENFLYYNDGDTIHQMEILSGQEIRKFGKPDDYKLSTYSSFLTISTRGDFLWAGFTDVENTDARIYTIDLQDGKWDLKARFPGNFDLEFWGDSILVSGTNDTDLYAECGIFVLDTSGRDQHRLIIDAGGSSAGLAVDSVGNLYFGSSLFTDENALYRWDSLSLDLLVGNPQSTPLGLTDGEVLSTLPSGSYDCEVDTAQNVVFTMNLWGGTQVLAQWNGTPGKGPNYDTLAVSDEWLTIVKSRGAYTTGEIGNSIYVQAYGQPLADVHTVDYPPVIANPLPDLTMMLHENDTIIDIGEVFTDPDDPDSLIIKEIVFNSGDGIVDAHVEGDQLKIHHEDLFAVKSSFLPVELILEGTSSGLALADTFLVNLEVVSHIVPHQAIKLQVFPNPSQGIFRIEDPGLAGSSLKVFSLEGLPVSSESNYQPGIPIDITRQPAGAYILQLVHEGRQSSTLIIKK